VSFVQLAHSLERTDDEVTVVLAGEADLATIDQLRDALFDAVAERPSRVVVDLRGLIFIDSMSISALIAARRAALEHAIEFVVTHPRGQVLKIFKIAGVLDTLTSSGESTGDGLAGGGLGAAFCA
jgi:anti-anti-sigma factor